MPCRHKVGAKIQCSTCYSSYHPLCARIAGLHMEITDGPSPDSPVRLVSFCPRHCTAKPELSGIQVSPMLPTAGLKLRCWAPLEPLKQLLQSPPPHSTC